VTRVFVSYRRSDTGGYAGRLRDELLGVYGPRRVFWDLDTIQPGADLNQAIRGGLRDCRVLLVLIGHDWAGPPDEQGRTRIQQPDDWVALEVAWALDEASQINVIPVLVDGARMPKASELPEALAQLPSRAGLELRNPSWAWDVDRIVGAIDASFEGRSWRRRLPRPARRPAAASALLLSIAALAVGGGLALQATGALPWAEQATVDARFSLRAPREKPKDTLIVGIDRKSLQALGMRPERYNRRLHAKVMRRIAAAGPRVLAYDIAFSAAREPKDSEKSIEEDNALFDGLFAASDHRPVVLAANVTKEGRTQVLGGWGKDLESLTGAHRRAGVRAAAAVIGLGAGATMRRVPSDFYNVPSFARASAEAATGRMIEMRSADDPWIDYQGPPGTFDHVSFVDVLRSRIPARRFKDKIVLVGFYDASIGDMHPTSLASSPSMTGVEIEANAIHSIIRGLPLKALPDGATYALIIALGCLAPLIALMLPELFAVTCGFLAIPIYLVAAKLAFDHDTILPVVPVLVALFLSAAGVLAAVPLLRRIGVPTRARRLAPVHVQPVATPRSPV